MLAIVARSLRHVALSLLLCLNLSQPAYADATAAPASASAASNADDPFGQIAFIEGTWDAAATGAGGARALGTYTFRTELGGHILARHATTSSCDGPRTFDCQHNDLLYVYRDSVSAPLAAIYFDDEGHTIHYTVATPTPTSVTFLSDPSQSGPQFRLIYERSGDAMSGRFQVRVSGQDGWKSYLEWTGQRHVD